MNHEAKHYKSMVELADILVSLQNSSSKYSKLELRLLVNKEKLEQYLEDSLLSTEHKNDL
jgi:hypothetical protein